MRTALVLTLGAAGLATSGLPGCAAHNRAISPGPRPLAAYVADASPPVPGERSLTNGHDRSHWRTTTIPLAIRGVVHEPHYDWSVDGYDDREGLDALANAVMGFAGLPLTVVEAFHDPPWSATSSPERRYRRLEPVAEGDRQRWHAADGE